MIIMLLYIDLQLVLIYENQSVELCEAPTTSCNEKSATSQTKFLSVTIGIRLCKTDSWAIAAQQWTVKSYN